MGILAETGGAQLPVILLMFSSCLCLMLPCSIIYPGILGFFTCGFGKGFTQMFCPGGLLAI